MHHSLQVGLIGFRISEITITTTTIIIIIIIIFSKWLTKNSQFSSLAEIGFIIGTVQQLNGKNYNYEIFSRHKLLVVFSIIFYSPTLHSLTQDSEFSPVSKVRLVSRVTLVCSGTKTKRSSNLRHQHHRHREASRHVFHPNARFHPRLDETRVETCSNSHKYNRFFDISTWKKQQ